MAIGQNVSDKDRRGLQRQFERRAKKILKGTECYDYDNTPADARMVILVLGGFLVTLFFVTKIALGL